MTSSTALMLTDAQKGSETMAPRTTGSTTRAATTLSTPNISELRRQTLPWILKR